LHHEKRPNTQGKLIVGMAILPSFMREMLQTARGAPKWVREHIAGESRGDNSFGNEG
jgi:hypothetical protein